MSLSISVVAPASYTDPQTIADAVDVLETLGIHAHVPSSLQAPVRYLAGDISHRLAQLHAAYDDPETQAVWAVRGGYGCAQLVEHIDWARLSAKPLIGYSDISVLLDQCHRHGLPAIHGPVMKEAARLRHGSPEQRHAMQRQLDGLIGLLTGERPGAFPLTRHEDGLSHAQDSVIEGPVVGGNLMTLACVTGTPSSFVAPPDALVILEDVGEPYYRLERALWQLVHAGAFEHAAAICLGTFEGCSPYGDTSLETIFAEVLRPLGVALYSGLPVGHGLHNLPWRYGAHGRLVEGYLELKS